MSNVLEYTALPTMTVLDNPIIYWLKRDLWTKNQASLLLTYLDPRDYSKNDYDACHTSEMDDLIECSIAVGMLKADYPNFENSIAFIPLNIVKWAINKELDIPKLLNDWYEVEAAKQSMRVENLTSCEYSNPSHPMFSQELNIAIEAWNAVLLSHPDKPNKGSRKTLIINWLKKNHNDLTGEAIERISVMLNPDGNGGSPKTY
jgi:hypothetical protein